MRRNELDGLVNYTEEGAFSFKQKLVCGHHHLPDLECDRHHLPHLVCGRHHLLDLLS